MPDKFERASKYIDECIVEIYPYGYKVVMELTQDMLPSDLKHMVRGFEVRKTYEYNTDKPAYYMVIEDDPIPIIISEETMLKFYMDHTLPLKIAYNTWFDRYR